MSNDIEILCILDASGSMSSIRDYAISSFNEMLEERKKDSPDATFSLVVFNQSYEFVAKSRPVHAVDPLTQNDYVPGGMTALYDAIGVGFKNLGDAEKAFICIITDGMENASKEYTNKDVEKLIAKAYEKGYKVLFIGASKEQIEHASTSLGINTQDTQIGDFTTSQGMRGMTISASEAYKLYTGKL